MTWSTFDLVRVAILTFILGYTFRLAWETWFPPLLAWWRRRHARRRVRSIRRWLENEHGLDEELANSGTIAFQRWMDSRCPFCGHNRAGANMGMRCEVQKSFVNKYGVTTLQAEDFELVLDHIFGQTRDLRAEE